MRHFSNYLFPFTMGKKSIFMQSSMKITCFLHDLYKILMLQQLLNVLIAIKLSSFLYEVQISTNYKKILLKFFVHSIAHTKMVSFFLSQEKYDRSGNMIGLWKYLTGRWQNYFILVIQNKENNIINVENSCLLSSLIKFWCSKR